MATSIVASRRAMSSILSAALVLGSAMMASAQSVTPTNATLPTSESESMSVLRLTGGAVLTGQNYNIAPLTEGVGKGASQTTIAAISITGHPRLVDFSSVGDLTSSDIALISCDPSTGNIDSSEVVGNAGEKTPKAIVLYSTISQSCNLTSSYTYQSIYTLTSQRDSSALTNVLQAYTNSNSANVLNAAIGANSTTPTNKPSTIANEGGPAPTTAVAMSILYSITGIITLLFLVIIATGAIRAHRHPERYGPRNGFPGRPRQSRAKGLARAMLETLPIVKFGDPEPVKPGQDVELEDGHNAARTPEVVPTTANTVATPAERPKSDENSSKAVASGLGAAQAESVKSGDEAPREGELGCSICTEDFQTGEDVRVLPCQHKYHPACIDPWLLNVSGTCPLCRHDLRPVTSVTSNPENGEPSNASGDNLPPPLSANEAGETPAETEAASHQRRRVSRLLDLNRLRHAPPDERIAALRRLREQSRQDGDSVVSEEPTRRARLTGRLRDTFRIRTRSQNAASQS